MNREMLCNSTGRIGWYSSKLNVTTFAIDSSPARCIRTNSPYTLTGDDPATKPSTTLSFWLALVLISSAISLAAAADASEAREKIRQAIRSLGLVVTGATRTTNF